MFKLTAFLLLAWVTSACAQEIPAPDFIKNEKGIARGKLIPGSTSPNGLYALFEFHRLDGTLETTETAIALAPVDKSAALFAINSRTEWQTDRKVTAFLSFLWNPASDMIATHDSMPRHSVLNVYRVRDNLGFELRLPDLRSEAATRAKIKPASIASSGQIPKRWVDRNTLEVAVHLKTKSGEQIILLTLEFNVAGEVKIK